MEPDRELTLHVDRDAADRIRANGGRLFLWNRPVGGLGTRDLLSYQPPPDIDLVCQRDWRTNVEVCVPEDFPFSEVIVRARRWPLRGIRVYANGRRWGWRGDPFSTGAGP